MDLGLSHRHVLITGASQGIGRVLATSFATEKARVSVLARTRSRLSDLVEEMGGSASGHTYFAADLVEDGAVASALAHCVERNGPFDVVIHNLGASIGIRDIFSPVEDWVKSWRLNVGIAIDINNRVIPSMIERGWGRIVHMSSRSAVEYGGASPYAAAKAYLNAYTTMLGREVAAKGVLVNAVMPSAIAADNNNWFKAQTQNPSKVVEFLAQHQSIGRLGNPEDIAPFVLLLASDCNQFAAGSIISVDGGSR